MKNRSRFEIIECSGTAYEIGKQYGQAARVNILKSIEALVNLHVYPICKATKEEVLTATNKYVPLVEKFDPELMEMLHGQADGAGVRFAEVFALRCWFELDYYARLKEMCTAFAVTGKATRGGKTIIGQNFDVMTGSTLDLVRITHKDGMKQLSLVFWGGGELTLNSAGLAIVLNVIITPAQDQELTIPCCCLMPKVMRQKRLGDALGLLCTHGRSVLHYGLAGKEGEIFSVETKPGDFNVIQPDRDILVHTNHFLSERFKVHNSRISDIRGGTYFRQQRLSRLIEENYGDLTVEKMMELMADHHNYPQSICEHPFEERAPAFKFETEASIIMVPEDGLMYVTDGTPCNHDFEEYKL